MPEFKEGTPDYHWDAWRKNPNKHTMATTVRSLDKEINNFANSYSSSIDAGMARSRARKYAIDAVKSYDPSYGASLKTHYFNYVKPLAREMKSQGEAISLSKHYETGARKYVNFINNFYGENGREPDDDEIMDGMSLTPKQLTTLNKIVKYEVSESELENYNMEDANDEFSNKLNMWTDYVREGLPPKQKQILDLKIGKNGNPPMTNAQVAAQLRLPEKEVADFSVKVSNQILDRVNTPSKSPV